MIKLMTMLGVNVFSWEHDLMGIFLRTGNIWDR
jgi:hypothetical protein